MSYEPFYERFGDLAWKETRNSASHQSELAPALLEKVRDVLLTDPEYIARLKQHYRMFKEKVDPQHFRTASLPESEIRPIPKYRKRPRSK